MVSKLIDKLQKDYRGRIPEDIEELKALPGVGDYVSKAVRCYAFGRREAPIDSNVVRVIARVRGQQLNTETGRRDKDLASFALSLIPRGLDGRRVNLALLDLGALVCKPVPRCNECPLASYCNYYNERRVRQVTISSSSRIQSSTNSSDVFSK